MDFPLVIETVASYGQPHVQTGKASNYTDRPFLIVMLVCRRLKSSEKGISC